MSESIIAYLALTDLKQQTAIMEYCEQHGLDVGAVCSDPQSAAAAVKAGARVVVAATDPRDGLRQAVIEAGGEVLLVRERTRLPTLRDFLARALRLGRTESEIAEGVGQQTADISDLIRHLGLRPPN